MTCRTCTVMIQADGSGIAIYAVMRGPVSRNGRVFDAHRATMLASYRVARGDKPNYAEMTARHATSECPAVYWQRVNHADRAAGELMAYGDPFRG